MPQWKKSLPKPDFNEIGRLKVLFDFGEVTLSDDLLFGGMI